MRLIPIGAEIFSDRYTGSCFHFHMFPRILGAQGWMKDLLSKMNSLLIQREILGAIAVCHQGGCIRVSATLTCFRN